MIRASRNLWLATVAALLLGGLLWLGLDRLQGSESFVLDLEPGSSTVHRLGANQLHEHTFHLDAGEYLELAVEQRELNVSVSLVSPDEEELVLADSWIGALGPDYVAWIAETPGIHRLLIRAAEARAGRYDLQVYEHRPATADDRDRATATARFSEAEKLRRHGDVDSLTSAIELYQSAADLWERSGEPFRQAVAAGLIGRAHDLLGNPEEASRRYRSALELFHNVNGSHVDQQVMFIHNFRGSQQRRLGRLQEARNSYQEARKLARRLGEQRLEANFLNNLAIVYRKLGDINTAIDRYEQSLALHQTLDEPATLAMTLCNVAQFYMVLGDLDRAQERLQEALRLSSTSERPSVEARARALRGLGVVARRQGRLQDSSSFLRQALDLDRKLNDRSGQGSTLTNLGWTYYLLSEDLLSEDLLLEDQLSEDRLFGDGDRENPYGKLSVETYEEALEVVQSLGDSLRTARALYELGWVMHEVRGDPQQALAYFEQALDLFRQIRERAGDEAILAGEASAEYAAARAERLDHPRAALHRVERAIGIVESLRSQTDVAGFRTSYFATKQDYYELAIDLLVDLREPARALEVSERRRARTLFDVLQRNLSADDGILTPSSGPGILAEELLSEDPPALDPRSIQELLDPDTILLEYSLGEERSFLWLVTPTDLELHVLPAESAIDALARQTHRLLSKSRGRRGRGLRSVVTQDLSSLLLAPVADRLGSKRLLIVTEEALQYVPFGALPIPDSENGDPMVTKYEIVYLPALSILDFLRQETQTRTPAPLALAVVADPVFNAADPRVTGPSRENGAEGLSRLPSTLEEALDILSLVPEDQGLALFGFDANRERVLGGELADYRYIHFATHGWFDPEKPALSGLLLSGVDREGGEIDGFLGVSDIYRRRLQLPVEMVALSACRTGLGEEVRGEGLVGLTQSFLYAGAARVIVSYWEVEDEATTELMVRVYQGIFQHGLPPAAALREAQKSMLASPKWNTPYYWAGFFLQGEWR